MKIKVIDFKESTEYKDTATILLEFIDDKNNSITYWEGKYRKRGSSFCILDQLNNELFLHSIIDWNDIPEDVENALLAFDLKYNIDIK